MGNSFRVVVSLPILIGGLLGGVLLSNLIGCAPTDGSAPYYGGY